MKTKLLLIAIITSVFLTGCINLTKKTMPQKYYALTVATPQLCSTYKMRVLEIYPPQIAPQFSGASFVYRTNDINYTSDYYNAFFSLPAEQIQQNSIKYLQASKIFKYATDNIFPLKADYALKTNILELYADYRNPQIPKAVISIQYVFINLGEQPTIIFNKTFNTNIPLTEKNSTALVNGWNKGLQKIFRQLIIDMDRELVTPTQKKLSATPLKS